MKVTNVKDAWKTADEIFPTDYIKDEAKSVSAGYDIYTSTALGCNDYICDLGDRLEINYYETGKTVNIWIEEEPQFEEYQIADALKVIDEAIYQIDDHILPKLQAATGIDEARKKLYGAYAEIAKILKSQHPESKLYAMYNLQYA